MEITYLFFSHENLLFEVSVFKDFEDRDEKNRSPKGDGNRMTLNVTTSITLDEKNRSPKGDGNSISTMLPSLLVMRRIGPRKGTETFVSLVRLG